MNLGIRLWAWVSEMPDGSVSTVGAFIPQLGGHIPLIGRSKEHIKLMQRYAEAHKANTGQRVWLREYALAKDHEELS